MERLITCARPSDDRLRVGLVGVGERRALGGVPREQNMLKGHLPRVIYHQVILVYEDDRLRVIAPPRMPTMTGILRTDDKCTLPQPLSSELGTCKTVRR